ncbi:GAP1-M domain-containing protein [Bacillus sp. Au-Bac7]|uniref:GAP1-M domain-containing protein n=1 Tax=Bacillus sp. Au-Bac7 TaxID=2906458 RepID=UPI001E3AF30E|nr:hypothetical protein [Bacillus sp. Au-Bac7]MCE4049463.1 hypothetical protein [Bacillus sp. Au-Bac7]
MGNNFIKQYIYMKSKKGLGEGIDRAIFTPELDEDFIEKYLQPLSSLEIQKDNKHKDNYPPSFLLIQPETGQLVIGQQLLNAQSNILSAHYFIIPGASKDEWVKNPEKLFHAQFANGTEVDDEESLAELADIPYKKTENIYRKKQELFYSLKIDESIFKKLLLACLAATESGKTVYISLDVPILEHSRHAMTLLELLYIHLPYAARAVLGAVSFKEAAAKQKYVHLMFVEPGSIRLRNHVFENQFVFDFTTKRISGVDMEGQKHEYLDFAYDALQTASRLDDFFLFAERALKGLKLADQLNISYYNRLCAIYLLEETAYDGYERDKLGILQLLLALLQKNHKEKPEIIDITGKILHRERLQKDPGIAKEYMKAVFAINQITRQVEAVEFTVRTLAYFNDEQLAHEIWTLLQKYPLLYKQVLLFMDDIKGSYQEVLFLHVDDKLSQRHSLELFLANLADLLHAHSFFIDDKEFVKRVKKRFLLEVKKSSKPFFVAEELFVFLTEQHIHPDFIEVVMPDIKLELLKLAQLERLQLEDVRIFGVLFLSPQGQRDAALYKKGVEGEIFRLLSALYKAFFEQIDHIYSITELVDGYLVDDAKQAGKNMMKEAGLFEPFERLVLFFQRRDGKVEHDKLFAFLAIYGTGVQMLEYIRWSYKKYGMQDIGYVRALKGYLAGDRNSIWKDKDYQRKLKAIRSQSFKKLLKEVKRKRSSKVSLLFGKYGFLLVLIAILAAGSFLLI